MVNKRSVDNPPPFNFCVLLKTQFKQDSLPIATQQGCCVSTRNTRKSLVVFYTCIQSKYLILTLTAALKILSRPASDLLFNCL